MNTKTKKYTRRFVRYIRRTYKNKLHTLVMFMVAAFVTFVIEDATFLVFTMVLGIPIFFSNENWVLD